MSNSTELVLPSNVIICEVAPRDGFQAVKDWIPTEDKIAIVKKLAQMGVQSLEITSFVHPKAIPQLKDASEVVEACQDLTDIKLRALVPNVKGAERAIDAGIKKLKLMLSATDSHSISNANCVTEEAQNGFLPIVELAEKRGVQVGGSISVAFGCPYEGKVPQERLDQIVKRYMEMGVAEISLADSTGAGNPKQVYEVLGYLRNRFPNMLFTMHLHNTRGLAIANAVAALQQGITNFDSAIAGLGGCPYLPGATGNVATEDLVNTFHEMGIETGMNLDTVIGVAKKVKEMIGHKGASYMLQAGPCSTLHAKPKSQKKVEK
ncbi:hydroxymethylglutaryl-CoA lyase [Anaerobacillus arseniciselenatis]|uniref:Hydroxymethylglutaryl-CoA lyase n=1 Tax=Anaerobacillus arseniciselenatis TaxID=85682 RepID=A0A1S2LND1_9BACI|nr:hydroxymethylglutaryl-CoA lyase [Anaerobacillus arseniciselenatis]OIJ14038.1 hydroxymethylglutaryl-CoA lyase [Anaerobacillus arseniciselenatis]